MISAVEITGFQCSARPRCVSKDLNDNKLMPCRGPLLD